MTSKPKPIGGSPVKNSAGAALGDWFGNLFKPAPASNKPMQMNSGGSFFGGLGGAAPKAKPSTVVARSLQQTAPKTSSFRGPLEPDAATRSGVFGEVSPAALQPVDTQSPSYLNSLMSYMDQAKQLGLGGGTNYDALISQLQANGNAGDAKLAAMYSQLGSSVAGDASGIKSLFDQTGANEAATSDAARTSTDQAYQGTRNAQTAQLQALGIGNAAGVLAANGGLAANDQAHADANIAASKANSLNLNSAQSANAQNYNTGVKEGVGQQGVEARSKLQQQLAAALANLESQKATANSGTQTALFNAALQLKGLDPNDPANIAAVQQASTSADLSNQLKASQIALNVSKASGSAQTLKNALAGSVSDYTALQKAYQKAGGDPSNTTAFGAFVTQLKTINGIK